MAFIAESNLDFSSLSLYKPKLNPILSLSNQNQRRSEVLKRQKEKRNEIICQLRFSANDESTIEDIKTQWPPRQHKKPAPSICPIDMMLAEWLFSPPDDIQSWFVIACPRGQRCIIVADSHRTHIYGKHGNLIRTMFTNLPKKSILYCIYDNRTSIYHVIDLIMWNGQDYSTQVECQCRFFVLESLIGDTRLNEHFQIVSHIKLENQQDLIEAEDGYLFYHPLGFYEPGYSPLACWLQPFMIEEILGIKLSYPITKPDGYTTAHAYMLEEQTNRKEYQSPVRKSHKKKSKRNVEELMSVD